MKTTETQYQRIFQSCDGNGTFELRIHKDCSQIQLESGMNGFSHDVFVDTDRGEIIAIRDMIDEILER